MTKNQEIKVKVGVGSNPEVKEPGVSPRKRKNHTAEYKLRILKEAELSKGQPGGVGALLRREGLYSSLLSEWRRQRDDGSLSALSSKRGRKLKHTPQDLQMERLQRENRLLAEKLRQANLIIEAQKKISEILGLSASMSQSDGERP